MLVFVISAQIIGNGDGFVGLEDKRTRPTKHSHYQMTLPFLEEVLAVQQEYTRAGRFRVHGLLEKEKGEVGDAQ